MLRRTVHLAALFALAHAGTLAQAQAPRHASTSTPRAAATVVTLRNGPNAVDLLGDGHDAQVFVARRENFNAHGFSAVAFHVRGIDFTARRDSAWHVVPFFGGPGDAVAGRDELTTSEGADCILTDLRVLRRPGQPVQVVVARRGLSESFADADTVRFNWYELRQNRTGDAGMPPYYFALVRTMRAKRTYCDVNFAFEQELQLGAHGVAEAEGGR